MIWVWDIVWILFEISALFLILIAVVSIVSHRIDAWFEIQNVKDAYKKQLLQERLSADVELQRKSLETNHKLLTDGVINGEVVETGQWKGDPVVKVRKSRIKRTREILAEIAATPDEDYIR